MKKDLEPVTMYHMFAKLFAHLVKEVSDTFGDEGKEAVRRAVKNFGEERGCDIARRAKAKGATNDLANYLTTYDMERSNHFEFTNTYGADQIEQQFTRCVFANQWKEDQMEEYGYLYCEMIDPAIARGYNENLECIQEKHCFKDGVCAFCFRMKK